MTKFVYESDEHVFPSRIVTDRLIFERVDHSTCDVRELYDLYSQVSNEETRYVTFGKYNSRIEAKEFVDASIEEFENGDSAGYFINLKEGDYEESFIGTTSFEPDWDRSIAESGIFLFKDFWGNGYSTERGNAMLELAFEEMDFEYWVSRCHPDNDGSIGAINKYVVDNGGQRVGVLPNWENFQGEYVDGLYFSLSRDEYFSQSD